MNRVIGIVRVTCRSSSILFGHMLRLQTAVTVIAHAHVLIDAAGIRALILTYYGHLIAGVISIAGRGVDACNVVDCLENLGLRSSAQHVAINFLLSSYFIG